MSKRVNNYKGKRRKRTRLGWRKRQAALQASLGVGPIPEPDIVHTRRDAPKRSGGIWQSVKNFAKRLTGS